MCAGWAVLPVACPVIAGVAESSAEAEPHAPAIVASTVAINAIPAIKRLVITRPYRYRGNRPGGVQLYPWRTDTLNTVHGPHFMGRTLQEAGEATQSKKTEQTPIV